MVGSHMQCVGMPIPVFTGFQQALENDFSSSFIQQHFGMLHLFLAGGVPIGIGLCVRLAVRLVLTIDRAIIAAMSHEPYV